MRRGILASNLGLDSASAFVAAQADLEYADSQGQEQACAVPVSSSSIWVCFKFGITRIINRHPSLKSLGEKLHGQISNAVGYLQRRNRGDIAFCSTEPVFSQLLVWDHCPFWAKRILCYPDLGAGARIGVEEAG